MANPTIYVHTSGSATNSGSTDTVSPTASGAANATVSGTTVTLGGSPNLASVPTDGSATIYLAQATNSNQKIFKITAVDNGAKTVTVSVAPTGISGSNWAIGGRFVWTPASIEGALQAGWTVEFGDTPAAMAGVFVTARASGDETVGPIVVRGKAGVDHPTLTVTDSNFCFDIGTQAGWMLYNLTGAVQGAAGDVFNLNTGNATAIDCIASDGGDDGFELTSGSNAIGCIASGCDNHGFNIGTSGAAAYCHSHDNADAGFRFAATTPITALVGCISDSNQDFGIQLAGSPTTFGSSLIVDRCTIYGNGDSGIFLNDTQHRIYLTNSVLQDNGDAAGRYNIEFPDADSALMSVIKGNIVHHSGGGGGANLLNCTLDATNVTTDPQLNDPANGDFTLKGASPARNFGWPMSLPGATGTLYHDAGAMPPRGFLAPVFGRVIS